MEDEISSLFSIADDCSIAGGGTSISEASAALSISFGFDGETLGSNVHAIAYRPHLRQGFALQKDSGKFFIGNHLRSLGIRKDAHDKALPSTPEATSGDASKHKLQDSTGRSPEHGIEKLVPMKDDTLIQTDEPT